MNRIFWAGDSTVKYNKINTYPQVGIGQVFDLYVNADIEIHNYAENGRSTKSFINEGRLDKIDAKIQKGDFLFIQFGHNDQKTDEERHTEPFGEYQRNLEKFIEVARKNGANPLLITPITRRMFDLDGKINDHSHGLYPTAMKEVAQRLGVPCVDLTSLSQALMNEKGEEATKKWFMHLKPNEYDNYPDGLEDNTHLRYEGAIEMARLIAGVLKELEGAYTKLLLA